MAGADPHDADAVMAGVQIRLDPGWKTYWRTPGDSGIPPHFDWSGSANLKKAEVLWPAPHRFEDAGGISIGYEEEILFPVRIEPDRTEEPVKLKLDLEYGICKDLCIPRQAELSLELPPRLPPGQGNSVLINTFLERVPRPAAEGELPALLGVSADLDAKKPTLIIDAAFPERATGIDIFIEADGMFVPVPQEAKSAEAGRRRYVATFASPKEAQKLKGRELTVTLVSDSGTREAKWTLD